MGRESESLENTIASLHTLLETPVGSDQIYINAPRAIKGPIFDIPFYIGDAGSSCLSTPGCSSSVISLQYITKDMPSREGRENVQLDTGGLSDCNGNVEDSGRWLPDLNEKMEDPLSGQSEDVLNQKRIENVEKSTALLPDLNWNPDGLRGSENPVPHKSGIEKDVSPAPDSLNSTLTYVMDDANVSLEPCAVRDSKSPNPNMAKMSEIIQKKCQDAITMIKRIIDEEGHETFPLLSPILRRSENSFLMTNVAGINILNFRKICQRLYQRDYIGVFDFAADVQSMLRGVAEKFRFVSMVRSEVQIVELMFFDIMKRIFPDTDFKKPKSKVQNLLGSLTDQLRDEDTGLVMCRRLSSII